VLPIRAVLYTLSDNSAWLIGVQILDGVGAGIFGALTPLVISDIMRGTGRYNLAQGGIATVQGIGASLSGLVSGVVVDHFGYTATFLTLGAIAASPWPCSRSACRRRPTEIIAKPPRIIPASLSIRVSQFRDPEHVIRVGAGRSEGSPGDYTNRTKH